MINWNTATKTYVEQLENKNQFVITYYDNEIRYLVFQSYRTIICIYCPATKEMLVNWRYFDYSKTTLKHFKIFVNEYTCYTYYNKQQFINEMKSNSLIELYNE